MWPVAYAASISTLIATALVQPGTLAQVKVCPCATPLTLSDLRHARQPASPVSSSMCTHMCRSGM